MDNFGVSFLPNQPGGPLNQQGGQGAKGQAANPYQSAIKILSLRLPRFFGGGGQGQIAPAPLLQAQGGMGQSQGMVGPQGTPNMQALMQLAGMGGPAQMPQSSMNAPQSSFNAPQPSMNAPQTPRIIPGLDNGIQIPTAPPAHAGFGDEDQVLRDVGPVTPRQDFPAPGGHIAANGDDLMQFLKAFGRY